MRKVDNIKRTLQIIRNLPLPIAYQQVEKWVIEYEEKSTKPKELNILKQWLSVKYKLLTWRKN